MTTETLTLITTPVTALRIGHKVTPMVSNSWEIQGYLNRRACYAHKLVGTVCVAVRIPLKRQTDPTQTFFGRMILNWEVANVRLAKLVAAETARQSA